MTELQNEYASYGGASLLKKLPGKVKKEYRPWMCNVVCVLDFKVFSQAHIMLRETLYHFVVYAHNLCI